MSDRKKELDELCGQCMAEYYDFEKLEFYECVKLDKIISALLIDEQFTVEYLSTATKEFFDLVFGELNDTAEVLLKKFPSKEMARQIKTLCDKYKDGRNSECVGFALRQIEPYL